MTMTKSLILMGIKHCGKTTQGKRLARHFGCDFFDTDDLILEQTGMTPRALYATQGSDAFLRAEENACRILSGRHGSPCVVATGGGICNNAGAVELLRGMGTFVFLNADETTACDRIIREIHIQENGNLGNLPAYIARENPRSIDDVRKSFHRFYVARQSLYKAICDIRVDMKAAPKAENMAQILAALAAGCGE